MRKEEGRGTYTNLYFSKARQHMEAGGIARLLADNSSIFGYQFAQFRLLLLCNMLRKIKLHIIERHSRGNSKRLSPLMLFFFTSPAQETLQ